MCYFNRNGCYQRRSQEFYTYKYNSLPYNILSMILIHIDMCTDGRVKQYANLLYTQRGGRRGGSNATSIPFF